MLVEAQPQPIVLTEGCCTLTVVTLLALTVGPLSWRTPVAHLRGNCRGQGRQPSCGSLPEAGLSEEAAA